MSVKNRISVGLRDERGVNLSHFVNLKLYHRYLTFNYQISYKVNVELMNIPFYFRRKTFPTFREYGVVDVKVCQNSNLFFKTCYTLKGWRRRNLY